MAKRTTDRVEDPRHLYLQTGGITVDTTFTPNYAILFMDTFDIESISPWHNSQHIVQYELCRRKWQWIQKKNGLTQTPRMKPIDTGQIPVSNHFNTEGHNHTKNTVFSVRMVHSIVWVWLYRKTKQRRNVPDLHTALTNTIRH